MQITQLNRSNITDRIEVRITWTKYFHRPDNEDMVFKTFG